MSEEGEQSHLFDEKLRSYEDNLVEIILDIGETKRSNPKMAAIACYLLIHRKLTQKELKKLTGFSMGTISTYLSVMVGSGNFQKSRIPHTHTFMYSFSGDLESLTTRAIDFAIDNLISLEIYLKNKKETLNKLVEKSVKGAKKLTERIEELLESFKNYKTIFPSKHSLADEDQKQTSSRETMLSRNEDEEMIKIEFDPEVYFIEDDILNQLITAPMFSMRDPMFIRILGLFMTRKHLTQETLKRITGLSSGKISEEVNKLLEYNLIYIAYTSDKGKITYGADSFILLRFSRYILSRLVEKVKELENLKLKLEKDKPNLESLKGYSQIYKIIDYTLSAILKYSDSLEKIDTILKS